MSSPRIRILNLPDHTYILVVDRAGGLKEYNFMNTQDHRCKDVLIFNEEVDLNEY